MVHYGVGQHAVSIDPPNLINAVKWIWLSVPFSTMSACFGKVSIALLLIRILDNRNKGYIYFLWVMIVLLILINIILSVVTFAQCKPVTYLWDQLNPMATYKGRCWDPSIQKNYGYFQGGKSTVLASIRQNPFTNSSLAFSAWSDLVLALLPILIIKDLQIEMRLKAALMVAMSMGVIATAAAIVKTTELRNLATPDFTYNASNLVYWFISENWLIIIAACIPTIGPLYFVILGKRTAESFAAPSKSGRSTYTGRLWKFTHLSSWKLRSFWTSNSGSGSSSGQSRTSAMEKGYPSSQNMNSYVNKSRNVDEQTQHSKTELVGPSARPSSAGITKTVSTKVTSS
jgi:hypothetical protein